MIACWRQAVKRRSSAPARSWRRYNKGKRKYPDQGQSKKPERSKGALAIEGKGYEMSSQKKNRATKQERRGGTTTKDATPDIEVAINIDESRAGGVYANFFLINTTPSENLLNFVFVDHASISPDGKVPGFLVSRVILTNESLIAVRDALNAHIEQNLITAQGDNSEK
jgi:hypothetical protein